MENAKVKLTAECPYELSKQMLKFNTVEGIKLNMEWGENDSEGSEFFIRNITFQELVACIDLIINSRLETIEKT